jgi:hypothetical protein
VAEGGAAARRFASVGAAPALATFAAAALAFSALPAAAARLGADDAHDAPDEAAIGAGDVVDLVTPFAVVGAAALLLASLRPTAGPLALAVASAVAYVDGHGIHLAANSLADDESELPSAIEESVYFWDERFGHIEWHLGWIGMIAAFVAAERRPLPFRRNLAFASIAMLGTALVAATVEGQTWWLVLAVTPPFVVAARRGRGHVAVVCAGAVAFATLAIAAWALYWGGVPQLTEIVGHRGAAPAGNR